MIFRFLLGVLLPLALELFVLKVNVLEPFVDFPQFGVQLVGLIVGVRAAVAQFMLDMPGPFFELAGFVVTFFYMTSPFVLGTLLHLSKLVVDLFQPAVEFSQFAVQTFGLIVGVRAAIPQFPLDVPDPLFQLAGLMVKSLVVPSLGFLLTFVNFALDLFHPLVNLAKLPVQLFDFLFVIILVFVILFFF